jgi:UDP:flavonoid glycosyltransferase YjiC (YdhE family)
MLALGEELVARGHVVAMETWRRWRPHVEAAGMAFVPAPEYPVFPRHGQALKPYAAVVRSMAETQPAIVAARPDVVVHDVLTLAPALSAELEGVPWATLVPNVHPHAQSGWPPFSSGARLPRTPVGRALWRSLERPSGVGLRLGRDQLNETRRRVGLAPLAWALGGLSRELCLVATFPQLEYPRTWNPWEHVVGPLLWEPPADDVEDPPGADPLVLVASSTAQDPDHRLLRSALAGLAKTGVRVLAVTGRPVAAPIRIPGNARLVRWASYAHTMPRADVVVCNGGHGTLARALVSGTAVVACPAAGDQNENAARVDWAGAGVRVPGGLVGPRTVRAAVRRVLGDPARTSRAGELARWAATHDGRSRAAELVERLAS